MSFFTKVFSEVGVPEHECLTWAFGEDYRTTPVSGWWIHWNKRHNEHFLMEENGPILTQLKRAAEIFKKEVIE